MRLPRLIAAAIVLSAAAALPARAQGIVIADNATAQCTDGTWSTSASTRGACSGHKGVKTWIGRRPRGAAARCNDGAYWTNPTLQGACSSHGGVYKSYQKAEKAERKEERKEEKREMKNDARMDRKMAKPHG